MNLLFKIKGDYSPQDSQVVQAIRCEDTERFFDQLYAWGASHEHCADGSGVRLYPGRPATRNLSFGDWAVRPFADLVHALQEDRFERLYEPYDGDPDGEQPQADPAAPPFHGLTPAETERLALLAEEAGEVVQAVTKILRHGYDNHHTRTPDLSNRKQLEKEIGHFMNAVDLATKAGDLSPSKIFRHTQLKRSSIERYLHHNLQSQDGNAKRTGASACQP